MLAFLSIKRNKRSVVVSGIVGFPGPPFDHNPFGITPAASDLRIDIILPVATGWKASFSVLEVTSPDIPWKRQTPSFFKLCQ